MLKPCSFAALLLGLSNMAHAQATLMIRADAACMLSVNGAAQGQLAAEIAKPMEVETGEPWIACKTAQGTVSRKISIESGTQSKEVELRPSLLSRFSAPGDGTVLDSQSGLQWGQRDNGEDVNWSSARDYCAALKPSGGGWRLPSMQELEGVYDKSAALTTGCGEVTCNVSPLFHLSGHWYWSNQSASASETLLFNLSGGPGSRFTVSDAAFRRALCVRQHRTHGS